MSHCTLPISLIDGKFLGSRDRMVFAGNSPNSNVNIQYVIQDEVSKESYFQNKCELFLSGTCTGMEICGVSRLAKSFLAIANTDQNGSGDSSIALVDIETSLNEANMKHTHSLQSISGSAYTSLSFYGDQEQLAGATDSGDIILWDLYTGKEIRRFCADQCGVNKIEFTKSGQLLTCGQSSTTQLHIWDIRTNLSGGSSLSCNAIAQNEKNVQVKASRALQHPSSSQISNQYTNPSQYDSLYYTSLSSQSIYNKIICGTSQGSIAIWDIRTEVVTQFQPYASNSIVTAVQAHPWKQDLLISASSCGHVKSTDLLKITPDINRSQSSSGGKLSSDFNHDIIVSEPAAFSAIDCDRDSGMLLAVSSAGALWRLQSS